MRDTHLPRFRSVHPAETAPPRLFVVVDTEEEFDWDAPFARDRTGVTAMRYVERGQRIFDGFGIKPTYVVDYPVASQADGFQPLREIVRDGRCTVGAHLHPWVNPPFDEDVSPRHSFTMNLPAGLQRSKISTLCATIEEHLDSRPRVFKAGRYGIDAATVEVLEESGILVDVSVCPRFDFSAQDGPAFVQFDPAPFFLSPGLLEVPCTVDYTGWTGPLRPLLHRAASSPVGERLRSGGILSRLRASNRIMLSPEGNTFEEMRDLARTLVSRGYRTFTLSFHSPSLEPGHTPYVRTRKDLDVLLARIESFCGYFFSDLNGIAATLLEFRAELLSQDETHESAGHLPVG